MSTTRTRTLELVYIAMFAVIISVCSWISIPLTVPFTMQTFAVFLTVKLLGGKKGTLAVLVYLLLGAVGVPVFAGFTGGLGSLFGSTGGYLIGFLGTTILYWIAEKFTSMNKITSAITLVLGLIACYALGTVWFIAVYSSQNGAIGVTTALMWCVIPFIIPDLVKLFLAFALGDVLKKYVKV